jgi:hypothetical protein
MSTLLQRIRKFFLDLREPATRPRGPAFSDEMNGRHPYWSMGYKRGDDMSDFLNRADAIKQARDKASSSPAV